jgi:hypothetical protein
MSDAIYANKILKDDEIWICTRWGWVYVDVHIQQVKCFEWQIKDCSKRLHKQLCKLEGRK